MNELEQMSAKISGIDDRLEKHEGKIERVLSDISESLKNISEVMIKQEIQGKQLDENHEDIKMLTEKAYEQEKQSALSIQSEKNIAKTADEIKLTLKAALKWGFGLFGSLMLILVAAAIKAFAT